MNRKTDPKYKPRTSSGHRVDKITLAPSWHELVQPGPKGDPVKKAKRLAAKRHGAPAPVPDPPKLQRTGYRLGGGWSGRLVLHRTRLHPVAPSRVDPSLRLTRTERRRLTRGTARPPEANAPAQ